MTDQDELLETRGVGCNPSKRPPGPRLPDEKEAPTERLRDAVLHRSPERAFGRR